MSKESGSSTKRTIVLAGVTIGIILAALSLLFSSAVKEQLWDQSVNTILESTQQGCNTLKVQLSEEFENMNIISTYINRLSLDDADELEEILTGYSKVDRGVSLYIPESVSIPADVEMDENAAVFLENADSERGILDPHISSVTGMNVFNLYVKVRMQDGTEGVLMKEYEVQSIVDSFSLSFYKDTGFSYVVNVEGDVLIRPPHPNSNKTVQNLFDMLPADDNSSTDLEQFAKALEDSGTGWAVFDYQNEKTVFSYTPLGLNSDWYLISIIPKKVVDAQTNEILVRALLLILSIIVGIAVLVILYFRYMLRTNRKLRNQAEYTTHLYNAVPEGVALMSLESPYSFLQLNKEGLRLLDHPIGSSGDILKDKCLKDVIHPEDYEKTAGLFEDTVLNDQKNIFESRIRKLDGSYFWSAGVVERTRDENGKLVLITAFHDITAEKLAEEQAEREKLQERMTLVSAISNAYPVIVSLNLTRDTLNFIYLQKGLMVELGEQNTYTQLYGQIARTVHEEYREEFENRFAPDVLRKTLGQSKQVAQLEAKIMLTDNEYHWISTQIIYVDNPYSEDKLAILLSSRVDERRHEDEQKQQALQTALESAQAASNSKSQFLSNMSHDIRTPMNAIVGMTAIAAAHLEDRERVIECLRKINLSSKHLLSLINDVLDMSKIESGKISLRDEPFNFAELAADAMELVRPQATANKLKLDIHLALLKNENVVGDPLRVRQILINILSNAVKYTLPGGTVKVEVRQEGCARRGYQSYVFQCADTGIGMSSEFMEKLFQPFERAYDSTSSKVSGTGLGMAITKNIVDLMNGDIVVESKNGEGSVFTVTLPLKLQDAPKEEVPEEWIGVHSLIVDDDLQTCKNASELLESMGFHAEFVTEGRAAVRCVVEAKDGPDPFELVIIDWKMPDMDGVEAARRIRSEVGPDIPVIVLTAYDWSEIENEAREAGVTAFLSKPFYRSKICYLLSELSGEKKQVQQQSIAQWKDFSGARVLIVEDNEINREIARTIIEELGVNVEEAYDGREALDKFSQSPQGYYDLLFMDIQMPGMNGYEATEAIRALERADAAKVPIVAMTANAFEEDVRAALRAGMNAHLSKPIDVKMLEEILYRYLIKDKSEEDSV